MTRKHYARVAHVLSIRVQKIEAMDFTDPQRVAKYVEVRTVAHALADSFAEDNERFDRNTFLKACSV